MAFGFYDNLNNMNREPEPLAPPGVDLAADMPEMVRPTPTKTKPKTKPKANPKTGVNQFADGTNYGESAGHQGQYDPTGVDQTQMGMGEGGFAGEDMGTYDTPIDDVGGDPTYGDPAPGPGPSPKPPRYDAPPYIPAPMPLPPTPTVPPPAPLDPPPHYLPPMPPMNLPPFPPMPPMLPEISFEPMEMPERKPYGFASVDSRAAGYSQALPGSGKLRDRVMGSVGRTPLQNALQ
tara:strand:- start:40182 stop:40883 length:702 start_codon:yes stop_codon:yes gene_type:complete